MLLPLYTVNAFTINNDSFTGNPAAICLLQYDDDINDVLKQKIASEMNLSQTAFVSKAWNKNSQQKETNKFTIRWFSPTDDKQRLNEIVLCGHATMATSGLLFQLLKDTIRELDDTESRIIFETKFKGDLEAVINWEHNKITLNFPSNPPFSFDKINNQWIDELIKIVLGPDFDSQVVQDICIPKSEYIKANYPVIRLIDCEEPLIYKIKPNFQKLLQLNTNGLIQTGLIVTQKANFSKTGVHFYSRFFAPWVCVNEDPVCGSAHTVLAPYWSRHLNTDGEIIGMQASKRGGLVHCKVNGDRVNLSGFTKVMIKGQVCV